MSEVSAFLELLADRADLLDQLKTKSKDEVLAAAQTYGFTFAEDEFDSFVWDAEARLARERNETFDEQFPLWQTMFGQYYLEYLVTDLVSSLEEVGLAG